jgi:hypothetical protein
LCLACGLLLDQPVEAGHLVTAYRRLVRPYFWFGSPVLLFQCGVPPCSQLSYVDGLLIVLLHCLATIESTNHFESCLQVVLPEQRSVFRLHVPY